MVVHKGSLKGRGAEDQSQSIPMKTANLRKVFIQRDYSSGTATRFVTTFPEDLEGRVDRHQFEQFITHLNEIYEDAEKMTSRTCCESCLACLTAYFIYICIETYYDKCMKRAGAYIEEQNDTIFKSRGVLVTDPMERGLRVIEITLFADQDSNGQETQNSQPQGRTPIQTQQPQTRKNFA